MTLTPCRFFAQGNCRFGNNCHFYHGQAAGGAVNTSGGGGFGNRTLAPATFQPQQQQSALNLTAKANQNLDIIVETVKKDMQEWQNSGIWPYSCYGPVGGKPCVPGFEDLSPEEYRYNYLLCGGNLPTQIPVQLQQMCQLRLNYQQYSQENRMIIEKIATTTSLGIQQPQQQIATIFGGGAGQQTNIFGGVGAAPQPATGTGSIFGGNVGNTGSGGGLFGSQQQSTGTIFGGASSTFGPGQSTGGAPNLFGQPLTASSVGGTVTSLFQTQQSNPSIFGAPPAFSTVPSGGPLFQQPQQQQNVGLLSNPHQQLPPNYFQQPTTGSDSGAFQQQSVAPSGGLFQQQSSQQPQNIFGGGSTIFGGGSQQPQFNTSSIAPPTAPSIFGGPTGNSPLLQGTLQQVSSASPATMLVIQRGVYTPESDLKPEELEAFQANEFTLENLPTSPPPQGLCL